MLKNSWDCYDYKLPFIFHTTSGLYVLFEQTANSKIFSFARVIVTDSKVLKKHCNASTCYCKYPHGVTRLEVVTLC